MVGFNKLLLAIDLSPESDLLISRVLETCQNDLEKLHIVHVMTQDLNDESCDNADPAANAYSHRLVDNTSIRVREVLSRNGLNISQDRIYLVNGEPAFQIKKLAKDIGADMVIVGSHSKGNSWMRLPGATTNCVIQGISSDVMAVKV